MQLSDQVNQQAAEWVTLMQSVDVSAADRQALSAWLLSMLIIRKPTSKQSCYGRVWVI